MHQKDLEKRINLVRRDLGNLLFHFTRSPQETKILRKNDSNHFRKSQAPLSILEKILHEEKLLGSSKNIRGKHKCICFTESPITEINSLFSLVNIADNDSQRIRYEPYGIAIKKEWLYRKGGRPVIYQPEDEYKLLPESLMYKHVRYEPDKGIDFTWEREWRIEAKELLLEPKETLVIVPDAETAFNIAYENSDIELDYDRGPEPQGACHVAKWMTVSLDLFGFNSSE